MMRPYSVVMGFCCVDGSLLDAPRLAKGAALQFFEGGHLFLLQDAKAWPAIIRFLSPGEEESD